MKPNQTQILKKLKSLKMKDFVYRFLSAFLFLSELTYFFASGYFTDFSFYDGMSFWGFLFAAVILTGLLFLVRNEKIIRALFLCCATVYTVLSAVYVQDYYVSFGLCLLICAAVYFTETTDLYFEISNKVLWTVALLFMMFYIVHTAVFTSMHYINYGTPCFDFGLFAQMFHSMKETGQCLTTCERDKLLSHFAVHFSPIYYLILPFYMLIPSPVTLLVAQAVIVGVGIIPLVLLCKHYKISNTATMLFAVCYALYPAFTGGCSYYLHENCFLPTLLLWLFYFLEKGNAPGSVVFALLTLCVKEDAAVYVAVVALYFLISKKQPRLGASLFALSVVAFILITKLMGMFGEGVMSDSRYGDYIYDEGGLFTVIKSVIQNPLFALAHVFKPEKFLFILQMLVPLCFLPLCMKKPFKLILWIPFLLVNLMTNYRYQFDIGYQYIFGSGTLLLYLAVSNYAELDEKKPGKILLCAALCTVILFSGGELSRSFYVDKFIEDKPQRTVMAEAIALIPEDATVSASTFLVANMSKRDAIYELERTKHDSEYIALDLREGKNVTDPSPYLTGNYETLFWKEDVIAIFKKAN